MSSDTLPIEAPKEFQYLEVDIPRKDVPMSYSEWIKVTKNRTLTSRNLMLGPTWAFDDTLKAFYDAFQCFKAKLENKPEPERNPYAMVRLPDEAERRKLQDHPDYLSFMTKRLGPRIFDEGHNEDARSYSEIIDRAKLYAERASHRRWNGGYEIEPFYYGETGDRIIMITEYYIDQFVMFVQYGTSHALLSAERIKQAEREAALAYRDLDSLSFPIRLDLQKILSDPSLLFTRGCSLGYPKVDIPRYEQCNIGSYPPARNYKPTKQDEQDARTAFMECLTSEESKIEVLRLFTQGEERRKARDAELEEFVKGWKEEREAKKQRTI
jgi:hypothetical protein